MSKATTLADSYEFCLSDDLKELAKNELRETCATRDFALKALRDWIESNPRIAASRMGKYYCIIVTDYCSNFQEFTLTAGFSLIKISVLLCRFKLFATIFAR